jgi:hypothetical protein
MASTGGVTTLREVVGDILSSSRSETERLSASNVQGSLSAVSAQDYSRLLRRLFDRQQISEIFTEFSKALPALNMRVIRGRDPRRFAEIAAGLGAEFHAIPFTENSRSGLRGFYIRRGEKIRNPLIYVNAAIHPVVMASSFWHELGHHLTARMFDDDRQKLDLSFTTSYHLHLSDPLETSADLFSILVAYPKPVATQLFARWLGDRSAPDVDSLLTTLRPHLRAICGFDVDERFSAADNLRHLAAIIHFGKLRWALLSEFEI